MLNGSKTHDAKSSLQFQTIYPPQLSPFFRDTLSRTSNQANIWGFPKETGKRGPPMATHICTTIHSLKRPIKTLCSTLLLPQKLHQGEDTVVTMRLRTHHGYLANPAFIWHVCCTRPQKLILVDVGHIKMI